ncbi:MAG: o-succinylbenzoate--CoA ligase [bacterium]
MKLTSVDSYHYRVALARPFISSHGEVDHREGVIFSGRCDDGTMGYGEIAPWRGLSKATLTEARAFAQLIPLQLADVELPKSLKEIELLLSSKPSIGVLPPALQFGLEMMFADLAAKLAGLPLARWLSPEAAESVPLNAILSVDAAAMERQIEEKLSAGYRTFKLKLLGDLESDLKRVQLVRNRLGRGPKLRLDANRAYDLTTAVRLLRGLEEFAIEFVEEPLLVEECQYWPQLAEQTVIALALDETVLQPAVWLQNLESGAAKVVVLKPALAGGLVRTMQLAATARAHNAEVVVTTMIESGIGVTACLHLAAALNATTSANGLDTLDLLSDTLVKQAPRIADGRMTIPDAPGLGVEPKAIAPAQPLYREIKCDPDMLRQICDRSPDDFFVMQPGQAWTYEDFNDVVYASARALQLSGIGKGDRVAFLSRNSMQMIAAILALGRLGAVAVPLNLRWLPQNWVEACRQTGVKLLLTEREYVNQLTSSGIPMTPVHELAHQDDGRPFTPRLPLVEPEELASIIFTSGSSGMPKGVLLTHLNHYCSAFGANLRIPISESDCWLLSLPLYHVGGLAIIYRTLLAGSRLHLADDFDAGHYLELIARGEVTMLSLVPAMLQRMLAAWDKALPPVGLKAILLGGAPLSAALAEKIKQSGWQVLPTYGLTETASQVTTTSLPCPPDKLMTAGRPLFYRDVSIVDEQGRSLRPGEVGEIAVGGEVLCQGYVDHRLPLTEDGLLRTGDLGTLDSDGYLTVKGRRDEMLISGGENIYPAEIVSAAESCPGVKAAAVIPIEDVEWGQRPLLCVEIESDFSFERLRDQLSNNLARFMVPERIEVLVELPRTGIGKIDRAELKRRFGQ